MIFIRIIYLVLIGFLLTLAGCKQGGNNTLKSNKDSAVDIEKPANIEFERVYYDFGSIEQGEKVSYAFKFKNTGGNPLIIKDAIASCGCTVPEYPEKPIPTGKKGSIEVVFDSKGRRGNQYKSVIVKTNSPNEEKRLTIKANVLMHKN